MTFPDTLHRAFRTIEVRIVPLHPLDIADQSTRHSIIDRRANAVFAGQGESQGGATDVHNDLPPCHGGNVRRERDDHVQQKPLEAALGQVPPGPFIGITLARMLLCAGRVPRGERDIPNELGRSRFSLQAQLFPSVSVAVDSKGLHLKRLPWHFMHPPLMIPWSAVAGIETMSARDFDADRAARQMGMSSQALRARAARMPGAVSAVMQFAGGSVTTVTLANPPMLLSVPAKCVEDAKRFLPQRPAATPPAPSSGSSEPNRRPKVGVGVRPVSS